FSSETLSAGVDYGYPITEYQAVRWGVSLQRSSLLTSSIGSAEQATEWVRNNGNSRSTHIEDDPYYGDYDIYRTKFDTAELVVGWSFDTRNRTLFADRGMRHAVSLAYTAPGSDVEYYVANYSYLQFVPLFGPFTLSLDAEIAYGM